MLYAVAIERFQVASRGHSAALLKLIAPAYLHCRTAWLILRMVSKDARPYVLLCVATAIPVHQFHRSAERTGSFTWRGLY